MIYLMLHVDSGIGVFNSIIYTFNPSHKIYTDIIVFEIDAEKTSSLVILHTT